MKGLKFQPKIFKYKKYTSILNALITIYLFFQFLYIE